MDDVKGKVKGFMKKVNNPFSSSSSSGKFKGQGRVLGSTSTSTTPAPSSHPLLSRVSPATTAPKPQPPQPPNPPSNNAHDFSAFVSLISTAKRTTANSYECPVCAARSFASEEEVSAHVETCLNENERGGVGGGGDEGRDGVVLGVATFLSGGPPDAAVEVVLKLLRNVVREPGSVKFRRFRMSNPKIKEAVGDVKGGVELLGCVGFRIREEEDGEVWAGMDEPGEEQVGLIREAVSLLERRKPEDCNKTAEETSVDTRDVVQQKKIDRQVRVFFLIPGSVPEKIGLPDSFYNLSAGEIKREVDLRKKNLAESQLLIPKSYKEKQMKAARGKHKATIIRIQFPDGVLLQGVFLPWEPAAALYQFVSSSLKDPSLEFELIQPVPHKRRVIPQLPSSGGKPPTLEEEDLVPSALVKFKPIETDFHVFTGLTNELLEASEPLIPTASAVNTHKD